MRAPENAIKFLPLPKGEGRGEGEGDMIHTYVSKNHPGSGSKFYLLSILVVLFFVLSAAAQPSLLKGRPAPEMDALFQQTNGWIGGDGAYSVALTPERTLWLFSDTWVGNVRDGRRTNVTMVNNTLALQNGRGTNANLQFIVHYSQGFRRQSCGVRDPRR